ncbi:MAG: SUMF1/EgtB/PvdO family nonheme iron enzyme [Flavobacteriales bacterium]|nr:SUMF1/EgtB/PvdO family nonheme iron enzyme [Flavobacteriales bacterium]
MKYLKILSGLLLIVVLLSFSMKKSASSDQISLRVYLKSFKKIPSGSLPEYYLNDDLSDKDEKKINIDPFYLCDHEVTNKEYRSFLSDLNPELAMKMLPDSTVWRSINTNMEPFVKYYLRNPAYDNYPVVGISHEQAKAYCVWLTNRLELKSRKKMKGLKFCLPTEAQWIYAASGGLQHPIYAWKGIYMRNKRGNFMASFKVVDLRKHSDQDSSITNADQREQITFMATTSSYFPNGYGLYNMCGNVSEYVSQPEFIKGGSYNTVPYYLCLRVRQKTPESNSGAADRGFRVALMRD